jgi:hypothetical protein
MSRHMADYITYYNVINGSEDTLPRVKVVTVLGA